MKFEYVTWFIRPAQVITTKKKDRMLKHREVASVSGLEGRTK
jgi:hypothetical protein